MEGPPPNLLYIFIKLSPADRIKQSKKKVTSEAVFGQRDTYKNREKVCQCLRSMNAREKTCY
jgi:hypothetical protein